MKKKISLNYYDVRNSFGHMNQSHPFKLFVGMGEHIYEFKSVHQAKKFILHFENRYNLLIQQFFEHIPNLFDLNISLLTTKSNSLKKNRESLNFFIQQYYDNLHFNEYVLHSKTEIENLTFEIDNQYKYYIKTLQKSNRNHYLLKKTNTNYYNFIRLQKDLELLFSNSEQLKLVDIKNLQTQKFKILKIA